VLAIDVTKRSHLLSLLGADDSISPLIIFKNKQGDSAGRPINWGSVSHVILESAAPPPENPTAMMKKEVRPIPSANFAPPGSSYLIY
jgi:hypothetical protein